MMHWEQLSGRRGLGREKAGEIRHEAGHSYRAGLCLLALPVRSPEDKAPNVCQGRDWKIQVKLESNPDPERRVTE